jgi:2-dehydro-3-deoxyphosphogluconate aldolase/(4S)-4-hydroxy-2-oxoglutarate aldolase
MARFSRLEVLNEIMHIGLVPIFYHSDLDVAKKIVAACSAGGARVVEYTNRGDNAYRVFSDLVSHFAEADPSVILGIGSVLNPEVVRMCNRHKVPDVPGCASPSEISQAEELGVEIVKIFPGCAVGGPEFVRAVLGPTPWTRMMPTSGVDATEESIRAWFEAGVAAVGIGSKLVRKEWVEAGHFDAIAAKTAQVIAWIRQVRGESLSLG